MSPLTTYIQQPELIDAQAVEELAALVDRHPTFQAARLLLLRGLYQLQDERFGPALRKAAIMMPDRVRLFDFVEGDKFRAPAPTAGRKAQATAAEDPAADRTQTLIDTFLSDLPDEPRPRRARLVDASVDYMSYLLQLDDAPRPEPETEVPALRNPDNEPLPEEPLEEDVQEDDDEWPEEQENGDEKAPSEAYFTETLARIYIKQGKYDKAIQIIRRLSLNYPKKNRYFADQIRFLEKLILNERCKNEEK